MTAHRPLRILLVGPNGQVGFELQRTLAPLGEVRAPGRRELDLTDADAIRRTVADLRPEVIVNAAAYTSVDKAEQELALAHRVNAEAPGVLAQCAAERDALLVHYSTDYVFDGSARRPYREDDPAGPLGAYGRTKLEGEQAVQAVGGRHLILRTAWVYGLRGRNFLLTMLRLARERDALKVVDDQHGAPTWSRHIAEATALILARAGREVPSGVYHLTSAGETTWYGFVRAIFDIAQANRPAHLDLPDAFPNVSPITSQQYPTPAARPAYSVLDNTRLRDTFGLVLPDWRDALGQVLAQ